MLGCLDWLFTGCGCEEGTKGDLGELRAERDLGEPKGTNSSYLVLHHGDFDMLNRAIKGQITYQNQVDEVLVPLGSPLVPPVALIWNREAA